MTTTRTYWRVHWISYAKTDNILEGIAEDNSIIPEQIAVHREFDNYEDAMTVFDRLPGPAWVVTTTETKWEIKRKEAPDAEVA